MEIVARRVRTTKRERFPLRRAALPVLALGGVVGLSLLASACGGGSSNAKVAQIGTSRASNDAGSSNTSGSGDPTVYSACMRSQGIGNFPDPDSQGTHQDHLGRRSRRSEDRRRRRRAAVQARPARACQKLQPNGGRPSATQQAQEQQEMLKYAQCMLSHGVPNFPDPKPGGAFSPGTKSGVDPNTLQFRPPNRPARRSCRAARSSPRRHHRGADPTRGLARSPAPK
jgi:hypothetical protein